MNLIVGRLEEIVCCHSAVGSFLDGPDFFRARNARTCQIPRDRRLLDANSPGEFLRVDLFLLEIGCELHVEINTIMVLPPQEKNTTLVFAPRGKRRYHFGMSRIKEFREQKGWSQADLAKAAGTSQAQITRLERNQRELTKTWAERLAGPLGTTSMVLLYEEYSAETLAGIHKQLMSLHKRS